MFDLLIPHEIPVDKAMVVSKLQLTSAEKQKEISKFIPRSYLVRIPMCDNLFTKPHIEQFNLWLNDFYDGNPPHEMILPNIDDEYSHFEHDPMIWRESQPSIDKGSNLWVSKLVVETLFPDGSHEIRFRNVHAHMGIGIDIIHSPEDFLNVMGENIEENNNYCDAPHRIVMKYVEQSPTFENKKADFRIYVFVTSLDPLIAYFHTSVIPVRQAREEYTDSTDKDVSEK